jgi:hypothetical protein
MVVLATYLGHVNIYATYWYLGATADVLSNIARRRRDLHFRGSENMTPVAPISKPSCAKISHVTEAPANIPAIPMVTAFNFCSSSRRPAFARNRCCSRWSFLIRNWLARSSNIWRTHAGTQQRHGWPLASLAER